VGTAAGGDAEADADVGGADAAVDGTADADAGPDAADVADGCGLLDVAGAAAADRES
jgi:hypothetical protein